MKHATGRPTAAETITAAVVERLEAGTRPWVQPWTGAPVSRPLRACGTPYRGINVLWLWMAADAAGHSSPYWMTYRHSQLLSGQVRKGERGTVAIFYRSYLPQEADPDDEAADHRTRCVLKSFTVFNACQIDGLQERFFPEPPRAICAAPERDQGLDRFFGAIPARIHRGGAKACYSPVLDEVTMPDRGLFRDMDHYHATLAHELSHWTGHESRLARNLSTRFGSEAYAMEELAAELSSAFLGAELGLPVEHLDHHASYLASWLKVLKSDSRAILTIASKAEEAASFLLRLGGRGVLGGSEDPTDEVPDSIAA
jgi:antirestriction protein ArdC